MPRISALATTGSSNTVGRAPVNGRNCSAQPSGVARRSQPAPDRVGHHPQQEQPDRAFALRLRHGRILAHATRYPALRRRVPALQPHSFPDR